MNSGMMTVREVARLCNRSEETIRRWIWSGKLPATKLGNQLFVRREDIAALGQPRTGEARAVYEPSPRSIGSAAAGLYRDYGYSPLQEQLREQRGQVLPSAEEEARNIADDEAFQDEVRARFGEADVVGLLSRVREG